ncbi:MAG: antibiotic biosynthesis monooxygenase [Spirochaetes bacterium]|jgi:autoinducer 2-degrading protein|nr:antibiotic biosynthesis monooxygenase [Spirochaetota bacterium]
MIVRIITVNVKPGKESAFEEATKRNHEGSLQEPGVLRFDVLKDRDTPRRYYLYEVYRDEAATRAHKETAHYAAWKEAAPDFVEGERASVACDVVAPEEENAW